MFVNYHQFIAFKDISSLQLLVCPKSRIECSRGKRKSLGKEIQIVLLEVMKNENMDRMFTVKTHIMSVCMCLNAYFIYICTYTYEAYINEYHIYNMCTESVIPSILSPETSFMENNFSIDWGGRGWGQGHFRMIQAFYIYCVFYFYYYYICSTSDHQALDPRDWEPLY